MPETDTAATAAPASYLFEFRGKGTEYFRIWIVNLALTILTIGIFSAWAKVRTKRYFNGSTFIGDHAFEYHASPWRILIGRTIAVGLFVVYTVSGAIDPRLQLLALLLIGFAFPWLVNASLRFNARNTSYRNVRFNFTGRYFEAMVAYVVWPIVGFATLGLAIPAARRARDFFYTNNHTYGGRPFRTDFTVGQIYLVCAIGIGVFLLVAALCGTAFWFVVAHLKDYVHLTWNKQLATALGFAIIAVGYFAFLAVLPAIHIMIVNLSVNHTLLDERHQLRSRMSPVVVAWITVTNAILTLLTLGLFYPWAKVRLARYQVRKLSLVVDGDIDAYVSETFDVQSAVGEEIGSFFSFDFGL